MTTQTEALKLALEGAANYIDALGGDSRKYRQALAEQQAQQEPVAWVRWEWNRSGRRSLTFTKPAELPLAEEATGVVYDPLYTSPQPAKTSKPWVGLTDEEIAEQDWRLSADRTYEQWTLQEQLVVCGEKDFARAIEAKLREKNT